MKSIIVFAVCLFTLQCYAQNAEVYSFKGIIKSKKTNEAVSFASITIKNTQRGVIANENGEFEFNIGRENWDDSVEIEAIGYTTAVFHIKDLVDITYHKLFLTDSVSPLSEVVITNMSAKDFVKKAFEISGTTFPDKPYEMDCFYQSTVKENGKYVKLLQALFTAYDKGFTYKKIDESVELGKIHVRKSLDYSNHDARLPFPFFRPQWLLTGDNYARNKTVILDNIDNSVYDISYEDPEFLSGDMVYVILAKAKESVQKFVFDIRLYIRAKDYAFLRIDFDGKRKIQYLQPHGIPASLRLVIKEFRNTYIFKEFDHRMYMRYLNDFAAYDWFGVPSGDHLSSCEENSEATLKNYTFPPNGSPSFEPFPRRDFAALIPSDYTKDKNAWSREIVSEIPFDPQIKIDLEKEMPLELQYMTTKK